MADKPLVSVIIPTKNSEVTVEKCLKSIKNQTYPNIEIIVVDNFSRDNTKKIAEDSGATLIEIDARVSEARNIGIERARGKFILSVDSDMELDSSVIDECVKKIGEGNDAAVIPETSVGEGFWARCKALEKSCYIGDELIEASRFFKKGVFEKLGCYDPQLEFGEDWDLNQRVRKAEYRIGRINAFIKHHEGKLSLSKTIRKKHHYGKTLEKYVKKHPNEAKQLLKLIRPAFIRNWRLLARDPYHALGMFLMKACEFGAARLARAGDSELETK
jgi:glycosyltransferase involved in cell wall biosynthesis